MLSSFCSDFDFDSIGVNAFIHKHLLGICLGLIDLIDWACQLEPRLLMINNCSDSSYIWLLEMVIYQEIPCSHFVIMWRIFSSVLPIGHLHGNFCISLIVPILVDLANEDLYIMASMRH